MISCKGQTIRVRTKNVFNTLFILGAAHNGSHKGWITFHFESGKRARGPFGLADWFGVPDFGEEVAFSFPVVARSAVGSKARLYLQYAPIPRAEVVTSITLPDLPNAKITALTLGWRDGVHPIEPTRASKAKPAPVAIFAEPGFPYSQAVSSLPPEELAAAFERVGIIATRVNLSQLSRPDIFNASSFPVLVYPYGRTFPYSAADSLRRYRQEGGAMVLAGPPFRVAVVNSPYGGWAFYRTGSANAGSVGQFSDPGRPEYMGCARAVRGGGAPLIPTDLLDSWGLGKIPWSSFTARDDWTKEVNAHVIDTGSLGDGVRIFPLLTFGKGGQPFAAAVKNMKRESPFHRCLDVWIGCQSLWAGDSLVSKDMWIEFIVRGTAWALRERTTLDEDTWKAVTAPLDPRIASTKPAKITAPATRSASLFPDAAALPASVLVVKTNGRPPADKMLFACLQGLINRTTDRAVYLIDGPAAEKGLRQLRDKRVIEKATEVKPDDLFEILGHRNAVIVDTNLYGSLNLAVSIAGLEGLVVAFPPQIKKYGLQVSADLRGLFDDGAEMLRWTRKNLWPRFEKRLVCVCPPVPEAYQFRDYAVANKVFTFWIPSWNDRSNRGARPREEIEILEEILAEAPVNIPVIGSLGDGNFRGQGTSRGVGFLSQFGKFFVPLDINAGSHVPTGLSNLTILSRIPRPEESRTLAAPRNVTLSGDKIYIAVLPPTLGVQALQGGNVVVPSVADLPRAGSFHPAALLDLVPGFLHDLKDTDGNPVRLCAAAGLGAIQAARFGDRYGPARDQIRTGYFEMLGEFQKRNALTCLTRLSNGDFRKDIEEGRLVDAFPAIGVFVGYHANESVNPLTTSYPLGKATVFHDLGAVGMQTLLTPGETADVYAAFKPLFLSTTMATVTSVQRAIGGALPPHVVLVTPEELVSLKREWGKRRKLTSFPLIPQGATWKYHDKGEDLGESWRNPGYKDSRWAQGRAELGYGDASADTPKVTLLSFGSDSQNKIPCYYFRHAFNVDAEATFRLLLLEVIRDDGCIVYLNGKEVLRSNMPEGEIRFAANASSAVGGNVPEEHRWNPKPINPALLRKGRNTIAAEVHQASPTSSDLSFDLKLTGYRIEVPEKKGSIQ